MDLIYRNINKDDLSEVRIIAEIDARIPLGFDTSYNFTEAAVDSRFEYLTSVPNEDFFEVVTSRGAIVGFHLVKKIPYTPNFLIGSIITLWVHPDFRNIGIASKLKSRAEMWARENGLIFMQTNVHESNTRMLKINQSNGYIPAYINLRKIL